MKHGHFLITLSLSLFAAIPAAKATDHNCDSLQSSKPLHVELSTEASAGTSDVIRPLWSYSQNWGHNTLYDRYGASTSAKVDWRFVNGKIVELHMGAAAGVSTDRSLGILREAYVKGKVWIADFSLGMEEYTPLDQHNGLGMGTYLMSDNARAIPKVAAGCYDWTSLPFIKDYFQFRGGLSFGYIPDSFYDGDPNQASFTHDVFMHEKFLYLRLGHWMVKPYLGLVHSVMMGGTLANGTKIPMDFWASFMGEGSVKMGESGFIGEQTNAAGAHEGMWDLGTEINTPIGDIQLYYQRPFTSNRSIKLYEMKKCKDFTLGADFKIKNFSPLKEVCFEYLTTLWEGGLGLADPYFCDKNGNWIFWVKEDVSEEKIRAAFSDETIAEWEASGRNLSDFESCWAFLEHYVDHDEEFGGRQSYLVNGYYPQGCSVGSLCFGSPMFMSNTSYSRIASDWTFNSRFPDCRMRAYSLGVSGNILPQLDYRAKIAFVSHHGTYSQQYSYWTKIEDYYFNTPLMEYNTGMWLTWHLDKWAFSASTFFDWGDMYRSASIRLGVSRTF